MKTYCSLISIAAITTASAIFYTQPYSLLIGCQVSSMDDIPQDMVAKTIPSGSYAILFSIIKCEYNLINEQ